MNIIFMGCVESSQVLLRQLINNISSQIQIVGVITKRKSKINADFVDLAEVCIKQNIDYIYADELEKEEIITYIKSKEADLIYCFGWSNLLSKDIIELPKIGVVGFHPAELPQNRGRHPIIWALALGLKETASTFFFINEGADSGDIISQEKIEIRYEDNARTLYDKILNVAVNQMLIITNEFANGLVVRIKQDETKANVWRKRTKEDGKIDWRMGSNTIYNLVRALTKPYIGAHFEYKSNEYKVWSSEVTYLNDYSNLEYGKVIKVYPDNSFIVKTGDGFIKILEHECNKIKEGDYIL